MKQKKSFSELKWHQKALLVLIIIVFSPFIAFGLVVYGLYWLFYDVIQRRPYKKRFEQSDYYKDLGVPYSLWALSSQEYELYNAAKEAGLEFELIRADTHYLLYENRVFIIPYQFDSLLFDAEDGKWYFDDDEELLPFEEGLAELLRGLRPEHREKPVFVLTPDRMIGRADENEPEAPAGPALFDLLPSPVVHGESCLAAMTGALAHPKVDFNTHTGGEDMVYGAIDEKSEEYYTDLARVFEAIGGRQKDYNWLITDCVCYPKDPGTAKMLDKEYCWMSGEELTELVLKEDLQWIWADLSAFDKSVGLFDVLKYDLPRAEDYRGFWEKPLRLQHPLAQMEIAAIDSSRTLLFSKNSEDVEAFLKYFPGSKPLEEHIDRL